MKTFNTRAVSRGSGSEKRSSIMRVLGMLETCRLPRSRPISADSCGGVSLLSSGIAPALAGANALSQPRSCATFSANESLCMMRTCVSMATV